MPDGSAVAGASQLARPLRRYGAAIRRRLDMLAVIAVGGALGALARYALYLAMPTRAGHFPWGTFLTNVSGSAALGLLLVVVDRLTAHRYVRPFLGTGVIGAYTTFSTYAVEADLLIRDGHPGLAAGYVFGSLVAGLAAVWLGIVTGRRLTRRAVEVIR